MEAATSQNDSSAKGFSPLVPDRLDTFLACDIIVNFYMRHRTAGSRLTGNIEVTAVL